MSKINDASLANLKHFESKWKYGQTRTIRVPIALADRVLALARRLDDGESFDTSDNAATQLYDRIGELTAKCQTLQRELERAQKSLDTAGDRIADLDLELENAKFDLKCQQLNGSQTAQSLDTSDMPDAADLLNYLKGKRKRSRVDLADVEAILELLTQANGSS